MIEVRSMSGYVSNLLKQRRRELGLSVKAVCEQLRKLGVNVSEKTLYGWEAGSRQPDADTFLALCSVYGIESLSEIKTAPSISDEAMIVARKYDSLDEHGKAAVSAILAEEVKRMSIPKPTLLETARKKIIPLLGSSFAAGRGDPDFGNPWEDYEVPADSPAEFAIHINGDSMEPYLHDGSIALCRKRPPNDGEVGAFLLDGDFLCKQICEDGEGNLYMFSLNRSRVDADKILWAWDQHDLSCFGTVIMDKRVPLPGIER